MGLLDYIVFFIVLYYVSEFLIELDEKIDKILEIIKKEEKK